MLAIVHAGTLSGIDALPVDVEVDSVEGLPALEVIGLPAGAVRESKVRVKAALHACQLPLPHRRYLVNLAPGDLRKTGSAFDLAMAVGLLASTGTCRTPKLDDTLFLGELSINGEVRPVRGALAQLRSAWARNLTTAVIPRGNQAEAALVDRSHLDVRVARHLGEVVAYLNEKAPLPGPEPVAENTESELEPDLSDVRGQGTARRALEIAAAGGHHLLLIGAPGVGKTMLARRLPGLLPKPTPEDALDIATIVGTTGQSVRLPVRRPFRAPHHSASAAAIIGGGQPVRPGEVTLAHGGVLFLDELPEFRKDVIESLRITMESEEAVVARLHTRVTMPARSLVVAAMNPCPCGYAGDPDRLCVCLPDRVQRYLGRISGPLLDRFDLQVVVPKVAPSELRIGVPPAETTASVRRRVAKAWNHRQEREQGETGNVLATDTDADELVETAARKLGFSARAHNKVLRIARTIADLEESNRVRRCHVAEALQYRQLERQRSSFAPTPTNEDPTWARTN